jgi:ADP-ribose pyrophosphatase YjhB (NUDIX family)
MSSKRRYPIPHALMRYGMHTYWRFSRGMTMGVRAVILDDDDRVFLIRHTYVSGWHLPGGGIETGETALTSLSREMREEANIEAIAAPVLHGVFLNRKITRRDHVLVYVVRDFRVLGPKVPDREIAESGFFPISDLPEGTTGATRRRLREVLDEHPLSETW